MDGIQAYSAAPAPRPAPDRRHGPRPGRPPAVRASRLPSDYLGAVRRRIWLVLLVAIPLASAGTLLVLRMPAIYSVTALITIEPPKTDPAIRNLVGSGEMIVSDTGGSENYVASTLAILNSKSFLAKVLADPALGLPPSAIDVADPAAEMVGKVKARVIPQSTNVSGHLRGARPRADHADPQPHS